MKNRYLRELEKKEVILSEDGTYTMFLKDCNYGPIISGKTYEETNEMFKEALILCIVTAKLLEFKDKGYWEK